MGILKEIGRETFNDRFGDCAAGEAHHLENGMILWEVDWNGDIYLNSTNCHGQDTGYQFRPAYQYDPETDSFEIIGYKNVGR